MKIDVQNNNHDPSKTGESADGTCCWSTNTQRVVGLGVVKAAVLEVVPDGDSGNSTSKAHPDNLPAKLEGRETPVVELCPITATSAKTVHPKVKEIETKDNGTQKDPNWSVARFGLRSTFSDCVGSVDHGAEAIHGRQPNQNVVHAHQTRVSKPKSGHVEAIDDMGVSASHLVFVFVEFQKGTVK